MATAHIAGVRSDALRAAFRAVWSAPTWRATSSLVVGAVIGLVSLTVVLALLVATLILTPTVIGATVTMGLLVMLSRVLTYVQRARFEALPQVWIQRAPPFVGSWRRRLLDEARDGDTWRQLCHHMFGGLYGVVAGVVVTTVWSAGLVLAPTVVYGSALPSVSLPASLGLTLAGIALLLAAPWTARAMATMDAVLGQALLGVDHTEELTQRVAALAASREGAVDAADAERRRIERDLHDGAQQRLTSLAVNLGVARTTMTDEPGPMREAIAQAHDEAKQALTELRDLVRGMHPAVLDDRGLDAALSGITARSPVPVHLVVDVTDRAAPEVEAAAYFVVSEALTNATAHAGASRIDVMIERRDNRLSVAVTDDGRGGADPEQGTGLQGLTDRVGSVDGTFRVDSPPGGPTVVSAEMPCEL